MCGDQTPRRRFMKGLLSMPPRRQLFDRALQRLPKEREGGKETKVTIFEVNQGLILIEWTEATAPARLLVLHQI